jgi:hypothetical protein
VEGEDASFQSSGGPQMSTKNNARVGKYRAQLAAEGYARMEVTLGRKLVKQLREIARQKRMPFWSFVEEALIAYAATGNTTAGNAAEAGNGK